MLKARGRRNAEGGGCLWNILDIFRQTKQNIFIPLVKAKVSNDEEQQDGKKS
jgi:hypothetical protein